MFASVNSSTNVDDSHMEGSIESLTQDNELDSQN